ncbi:MAG: hypothetical protein IPM08_03335 [Actinomycetales bacterium]|jgi:hypothetical protein|nr:hypothetical protein [Actinomycetales bacterium]
MADASVLAERLLKLANARGWAASASRFTVRVLEPAFVPFEHVWIAGQARAISEEEIKRVLPSRIIVEDFAPAEQTDRLAGIVDSDSRDVRILTYSSFVDEFWGAELAVQRALADSESSDADIDLEDFVADPSARHVEQLLEFGGLPSQIPDHRAFDFGLPEAGTCFAVQADAGLGKSELLKWHEWRYAILYRASSRANQSVELPPIAIRVPLRDLKSLSLDYIAHALSRPATEGNVPSLPAISSGPFLRELLVQRRIILLLDGLDEVSASAETVDQGVLEWRRLVAAGARLVVTTRKGHSASRGVINRRFKVDEIAELRPLDDSAATSLLEKRGADPSRARQLVKALSGAASGIPLFLLLAKSVDLDSVLAREVSNSKTLVLLELLTLFCKRDEERLGISAQVQMELLTQVAEWVSTQGPVSPDELLESLGLDRRDPQARVVLNPHALLINEENVIGFKYREFAALFSAKALVSSWEEYGFESISSSLRSQSLDEDVVEFAARLINPISLVSAWAATGSAAEVHPLLRRNVLAIALSIVNDRGADGKSGVRSNILSELIGERAIVDVALSGLYFERFDFDGWRLERLQGSDATLSYCDNLWRTKHDDSVSSLALEGCSFEAPVRASVNREAGVQRLAHLVKLLRHRGGRGIVGIMRVEESKDPRAWDLLVHRGFAVRSGKGRSARWSLTDIGMEMLTAFWAAQMRSSSEVSLLIRRNYAIRSLVNELGEEQ